MKKKWYRNNSIKGFWIVIIHVALTISCALGLLLVCILAQGVNPFDYKTKYENSRSFASDVQDAVHNVMNVLSNHIDTEGHEKDVIDLNELHQRKEITYTDTSGLAYTIQDLKDWANDSWERDINENADYLACTKPDKTKEYMTVQQFYQKRDKENLTFKVDPDSPLLEDTIFTEEDLIQDTYTALDNGYLTEGLSDTGVEAVVDSHGKVVYTNIKSKVYRTLTERYTPDGADSIWDIINSNTEWNKDPEEAFSALEDSLVIFASSDYAVILGRQYPEDGSNLTYLFADKKSKKLYSNVSSYKKFTDLDDYVDQMSSTGSYLILDSSNAQSRSNLNPNGITRYEGGSQHTAMSLIMDEFVDGSLSLSDNYILAVNINTNYPFSDSFSASAEAYNKYTKLSFFLLIGIVACAVFLLIGIIWMTAVAGRRSTDEDLHLTFLDRWFTEIVALAILGIWGCAIAVFSEVFLQYTADTLLNMPRFTLIGGGFFGLSIAICFTIGYQSLVRRIKAKNLWKTSLTRTLLRLIWHAWKWNIRKIKALFHFYTVHTGSRIRTSVAIFLFCLFQFIVSGISISGAPIFFLLLLLADAGLLFYFIKLSFGQEQIMDGLKRISEGELHYKIPVEKLTGEQKVMAEYINNIGSGLDAAVENSLKNERMKTELITNVSHDLKTPLTSIINYIDLLKRENFTDPKICGYLDVLEKKAHRLKVLTEDVVEASKASTGNLTLEMTNLNFIEMVQQVIGEFEERFQEKHLTMMVHFPEEPSVIYADGQRMWRVLENIFTNISKYAMEGTRVYAEISNENNQVLLSLKNISAQPLNISADELTERFIRGDVSRNTEGSGLGLSIAKSLTELQGGEFQIYLDGDLFKVIITFIAQSKVQK